MALQVNWSPLAQDKRKSILAFWIENNGDHSYSLKFNSLFKEATTQLSKFPYIGRPSDIPGVRIKIVRDYLLFYEDTKFTIEILTIWDSRQDPTNLKIDS
ncbi:type II toxin-antitoxin system RelE/ParE family toxin [Reichenbachiella ulvae]|uniref:Type II toxin-antitoxin system RelE/ParE family toxin n=1 Tax=Reichenbachiella ulvae TaxID=2980104 RepID=A0ABT3CUY2_9BACT|nr:type II toxin-antitoxin system RelE/ParE family toxin [Reichenbachiella ulvae]MCV9387507.1 type II toxin-antitoxin system RelE/ParE family toxin [Reichenbachiella ulvae]